MFCAIQRHSQMSERHGIKDEWFASYLKPLSCTFLAGYPRLPAL